MGTKTKSEVTIADIIYKGTYNILVEMETTKKVEIPFGYRDIGKIKTQMEIFNKQKLFMKISADETKEVYTFEKLGDETGKANFARLLGIAKKVFEPKLVW